MSECVAVAEPRPWLMRLGLFVAFVAVNWPLLAWTEFHNSEESVNVATAMELRRDGHWKVPTLGGLPRLVKPPMTAWMTAGVIRAQTLAELDGEHRTEAYRALTREARWPAMICAGVIVVAVFEMGRALSGWKVGLAGAAAAGTNFLLLNHASLNTTDVQLATWVAVANACMAHAVLRKKRAAWIGAGIALGLALMSKGPLALLMTVVPMGIFIWWRREKKLPWGMIGIGALLMIVIGGWWYAWVGATTPGVWGVWFREVTRHQANALPASDWWRYFASYSFFFPWVVLIIIGIGQGPFVMWRRTSDVVVLPWLLLVVPLVVMCFFHERKERYLLPMSAPAAVIAGKVLLDLIAGVRRGDQKCAWLLWIQWTLTAVLAVGLPIAGTTTLLEDLRSETGQAVFTKAFGYSAAAGLLGVTVAGWMVRKRWPTSIMAAGVIVFLGHYILYMRSNAIGPGGHCGMRPIAERVREAVPDARYYSFHPSRRFAAVMADGADLSIYVNRTIRWTGTPEKVSGTGPVVWFTIMGKGDKGLVVPGKATPLLEVYRRGARQMFFVQAGVKNVAGELGAHFSSPD